MNPITKLTTEEFLYYLEKSELIPSARLEETLASLRSAKSPDQLNDAEVLASEFVRLGLITNWHVRQLMKKKYKGFFLRQYRILNHLGTGGMSTVYLAEHTLMHRQVAIKVLPKKKLSNSAYLDRFIREAQAIASLDHPNIVRAYDIDRVDDIHYIVMEYFDGVNLRQRVEKEGPLAFEDAVSYIVQGAKGLVHAHRYGIVHRDVKPDNFLVNDAGTVKLLDMGLALLDDSLYSSSSSVSEQNVLGTADYLAPEQAINSHKVDARADIYGLGGTLYFCLTGHPPFPFGTIPQRLLAHQKEEPASIFNDRPEAPDDLVEICSKMMEKTPKDRFQSASEVVTILEQWLVKHGFASEHDFQAPNSESNGTLSDEDRLLLNGSQPLSNTFAWPARHVSSSNVSLGDDVDCSNVILGASGTLKSSRGQFGSIPVTGRQQHGSDVLAKRGREPIQGSSFPTRSSTQNSSDSPYESLNEGSHTIFNDQTMSSVLSGSSQALGTSRPIGSSRILNPSRPGGMKIMTSSGKPIVLSTSDQSQSIAVQTDDSVSVKNETAESGEAEVVKTSVTRRSGSQRRLATSSSGSHEAHGEESLQRRPPFLWAKKVPFWFWALFVAGYVLAIIFATIFFTLVTSKWLLG